MIWFILYLIGVVLVTAAIKRYPTIPVAFLRGGTFKRAGLGTILGWPVLLPFSGFVAVWWWVFGGIYDFMRAFDLWLEPKPNLTRKENTACGWTYSPSSYILMSNLAFKYLDGHVMSAENLRQLAAMMAQNHDNGEHIPLAIKLDADHFVRRWGLNDIHPEGPISVILLGDRLIATIKTHRNSAYAHPFTAGDIYNKSFQLAN